MQCRRRCLLILRQNVVPRRRLDAATNIRWLESPLRHHGHNHKRHLGLDAVSAVLLPPAVFGGLLITLWTYKCLMMVIFQNKIIYMPSVPPFSRSEKVVDYAAQCKPIIWTEHSLKSVDGTNIKLLQSNTDAETASKFKKRVVILYFQGNASSLPPRLPYLSNVLKAVASGQPDQDLTDFVMVALSYRGYWTSSGSASQPGIELDAAAALEWVFCRYYSETTQIVLWGQSIGAGAASVALANLSRQNPAELKRVTGLLLETPFTNIRAMLIALYPQRFLPYRYLAPFLRSMWDSETALQMVTKSHPDLKVLLLEAGNDEIVPAGHATVLEEICKQSGTNVERKVIPGALHTEVLVKGQGRKNIVHFLQSFRP